VLVAVAGGGDQFDEDEKESGERKSTISGKDDGWYKISPEKKGT